MKSRPPEAADWTYATQLKAAEACAKAGYPFGFGCGQTTDSVQTWGATFGAFGADLVDGKGNITVDSDAVKEALEYATKMLAFMPKDTVSYDDASNNRALISGQSAMIWNPPSAWAVAKRDAPKVAEDCWTFPNPAGAEGTVGADAPIFLGHLVLCAEQERSEGTAALPVGTGAGRNPVCTATVGYDIPPFLSMSDFKIWSEVEPPKGTVFNYPVRPWHQASYYVTGSSAPPDIAVQMWNRGTIPTMVAKLYSGNSIAQTIDWAKGELEGFTR